MSKLSRVIKFRKSTLTLCISMSILGAVAQPALSGSNHQLPLISPVASHFSDHATSGQGSNPATASRGRKLGLGLDVLLQEYQQFNDAFASHPGATFKSSKTMIKVTPQGKVAVDLIAAGNPQQLKEQLMSQGVTVSGNSGKLLSVKLPLNQLSALAANPGVLFARPALAYTRTGIAYSQGDAAMRADFARSNLSVTGAGTTVGLMSDSYNCLGGEAADIASSDLPAGVVVLQEISDCNGAADEGRAMAQIVHDVAPGAALQFHTAFESEADFAQGILDLANAGSKVIVDDVGYFYEPFFQDGVIAQAVDTVTAAGVTYFSAAGNNARQSYFDSFRPGTAYAEDHFPGNDYFWGGIAHDFDPGPGTDVFQQITCHDGDEIIISLQWDNPYPSLGGPAPSADIDIYLMDDPPTQVLLSSAYSQPPGDPIEIFGGVCNGDFTINLMAVLWNGVAPSRIKYVDYGYGATVNEYNTRSSTLVGHPNANGAIAVGASTYDLTPRYGTTPPELNYYSSAGGTPVYFQPNGTPIPGGQTRAKPEITAPDGGDNTFFGFDYEGNGLPNFFGTSAAAPHAAGVAALLRHASCSMTPSTIKSVLMSSAVDILMTETGAPTGVGFDYDSGSGLVNAEAAVAALRRCDVNADNRIDQRDLQMISAARNRPVCGANDLRDGDGDGRITPRDMQVCTKQCTVASCAIAP